MIRSLGDDRAHWLVLAALIAAFNGIAATVFLSVDRLGSVEALVNTFGINPIFWFVMFVAAGIAFEPGEPEPGNRADLAVGVAVGLLALVPVVTAGSAGVLLAGLWLAGTGAPGSRSRRAGIVLLALTTSLIWGHLFLMFLGDRILSLDGRFVAWLAGTGGTANLVAFDDGGRPMMIAYGCSSLHNITMAIQFWVALTQALRIPVSIGSLLILLAAVAANTMVNGLRLATIAHNRAAFDYWHTGGGATLFAWAAVAVVAVVVMWGCHALASRRV